MPRHQRNGGNMDNGNEFVFPKIDTNAEESVIDRLEENWKDVFKCLAEL